MSIWVSRPVIGHDKWFDGEPPVGDVRSYANGFSNHYPDDTVEQPSSVDTAHIPSYCVPGHDHDDNNDVVSAGPWLRLELDSWRHNSASPTNLAHLEEERAGVVMDEDAVRALVADLTDWLNTPKVYPKAGL